MFLTADELRDLTGYRRASAQVRWLRRNGYRFTVNGLGAPVVAVAEVTRRLVGGSAPRQEPRLEAVNG